MPRSEERLEGRHMDILQLIGRDEELFEADVSRQEKILAALVAGSR